MSAPKIGQASRHALARSGRLLTSLRSAVGERKNLVLVILAGVIALAGFVPWSSPRLLSALDESVLLVAEYARHHILLCLVPAFFIAGAITVFLNQRSVIKHLGPDAPRVVAYGVAAVSGAVLAVCSCTVLPLFKGIYKKGAGIGPAISFLYSGPAINVLAVVLTARVLGLRLGIARAVGAILFSVVLGILMHLIYRRDDAQRTTNAAMFRAPSGSTDRGLVRTGIYLLSMTGILVFLNWAPSEGSVGGWDLIYRSKYAVTGGFVLLLLFALIRWFRRAEIVEWLRATRDFAAQILPLLLAGVLLAGFLLGRPGHSALIPRRWIVSLVGGNSFTANLFASVSGALMYFATLTEVPIVQGLVGAGMGNGPALALLLAGPSLSLPSLLVIGGELGWRKTGTYAMLVMIMSTLAGMAYGVVGG